MADARRNRLVDIQIRIDENDLSRLIRNVSVPFPESPPRLSDEQKHFMSTFK